MHTEPQPCTIAPLAGGRHVSGLPAEGFIHLFRAAGKIFLDMMTGLIPMLICLLLAINFLMKLVGTVRMEKVAALLGRSRILTYGVLPVLGWFFMSSPGALTLGKLLPEKSKPGYEDALGTTAHPSPACFPTWCHRSCSSGSAWPPGLRSSVCPSPRWRCAISLPPC